MLVLGLKLRWQHVLVAIFYGFIGQSFCVDAAHGQNIQIGNLRVELERIVDRPSQGTLGFTVFMDTPNDGTDRLFFSELGGITNPPNARIRALENGSFSTFLDLTSDTFWNGETGFLGFTFHPGFASPASPGYRKLYTYHSTAYDPEAIADFEVPNHAINHQNVLTEWQVDASDPNAVDTSTRREIFRESHVGPVHAGGMLEFGPDGYLYGSIGSPGPLALTAQDNSNIFGTIFRIDPVAPGATPSSQDPVSANGKYRIPANNPYVDDPNALSEIYAFGVRSPYRFSIDTQTGLLFLGDVGEASREEVDIVRAGDNLGWPYREGTAPLFPQPDPPPEMVGPIAEYTHADGVSIIGGYVYRGSIPALQGKYIFGELSHGPNGRLFNQGRLFWIDPYDEAGEVKDFSENRIYEIAVGPSSCAESYNSPGDCTIDGMVNSFAVDDDGELYVIGMRDLRTLVYRITDAYFLPDGDYNQDGVVDAADYTVWRDTLGSTTDLRANGDDAGDSHGVIDAADFLVWKQHFGEFVDQGGAAAQVPGPHSGVHLLLLVACIACSKTRFGQWFSAPAA